MPPGWPFTLRANGLWSRRRDLALSSPSPKARSFLLLWPHEQPRWQHEGGHPFYSGPSMGRSRVSGGQKEKSPLLHPLLWPVDILPLLDEGLFFSKLISLRCQWVMTQVPAGAPGCSVSAGHWPAGDRPDPPRLMLPKLPLLPHQTTSPLGLVRGPQRGPRAQSRVPGGDYLEGLGPPGKTDSYLVSAISSPTPRLAIGPVCGCPSPWHPISISSSVC